MNILKKTYFLIFLLLSIATAKAELTFEVEAGVRPAASNLIDEDGDAIGQDAFEDPTGIAFSNDGLKAFVTNKKDDEATGKCIIEITLTKPFDFRATHTQTNRSDALRNLVGKTGDATKCSEIRFSNDGRKLFVSSQDDKIYEFNLPTPFNLTNINYVAGSETALAENFDFNEDGTKLYTIPDTTTNQILKEFTLDNAYDVTSSTLIRSTDLSSIIVSNADSNIKDVPKSLMFSKDGSMMFVLLITNFDKTFQNFNFTDMIFQFKLTVPFDTSTLKFVGSSIVTSGFHDGSGNATFDYTQGFAISPHGDKLFLISELGGPTAIGQDSLAQIKLSCFFGIGVCRTDIVSGIGAHLDAANKNIQYNNSALFKRFEWIKRNRDSENLNSFNINLKSYNPLLASLTNKLQASLDNSSSKLKSSTWSFWSTGDISFGRQDDTITERPKMIKTNGITFGADRKFGENFAGIAIRYAGHRSKVIFTDQNSEMETLTLNFYKTSPRDDNHYSNMLFGYSLLKIDQKYQGKKTGNRNGHQIFTSLDFRGKNKTGRFNLLPSGKLSYSLTKLSEFTDFISTATTGLNDHHDSKIFESGNASIGFLFDTEPFKTFEGTVTPNGGLEFVFDISPNTTFNYDHDQSRTTIKAYSIKNLRTNLGVESVYFNNISLSINYERFQHLDDDGSDKTETFIVKIGQTLDGESQFALNYDPINAHQTNLSYSKNIHGLDFKINSNQSLENSSEYFTNLEVSGKF